MVGRKICCIDDYGRWGVDNRIRIAPAQHGSPRKTGAPLDSSNKYVESSPNV